MTKDWMKTNFHAKTSGTESWKSEIKDQARSGLSKLNLINH